MRLKGLGDIAFAAVIASIVALLVVPLPTFALDLLLTANIAFGVVLLLSAVYMRSPLEFSTFPSMLLVATLIRLALNVSSTRLILGQADAGQVIAAFGEFVVGGNYIVGGVIFLILTIIQFLVIAKGSERVAEVAARFTLDAMPGKQMAIDADLRAGAFGLDEARRRRSEVQRESQLFGAMDGAMKFVKGDAIAGIIITVINISGGLLIGIAQRGMSAAEAAQTYSLLTIGDGLVSQIPALIVSIAAGLVVTRVASADGEPLDLGSEMIAQLVATPKVFGVAAGLLFGLGVIPGLPTVPFLALALAAGGLGFALHRHERRARAEAEEQVEAPAPQARVLVASVDAVLVEMGNELADGIRGGRGEAAMREELHDVRESLFERLGVKLPAVRIRFGAQGLVGNGLRIQVYEVPEVTMLVSPQEALALASMDIISALGIAAQPAQHPISGAPATLISLESVGAVRGAGHTVLDPGQRVMVAVGAVTQRCADRFIGLAEVQHALDLLEPTHGPLIDAVTPRPLSLSTLTAVLKRLVGEGVSVRDLRGILEALAAEAEEGADVVALTEVARVGLGAAIVSKVAPSKLLTAWLVDHSIEQTIRESVVRTNKTPTLALPPAVTNDILGAFEGAAAAAGASPFIIVASQDVRRYLRQLLLLRYPGVVVLGLNEVQSGVQLDVRGTVTVGQVPESGRM
ncbi:MAG: type III secretion protein V, partial [Bradymonadia bacterium]|jgi:type III secretion protein V